VKIESGVLRILIDLRIKINRKGNEVIKAKIDPVIYRPKAIRKMKDMNDRS